MIDQATNSKLEDEAKAVRQYISFNGKDKKDESEQAVLQSIGVAALWHRLQQHNFAYLADEVGMGKTRQAMGVIATQFLHKPDSRVVVICPGRPLQDQWKAEWATFVGSCLQTNDGVLKSLFNNDVAMNMALHNRLKQFAKSLLLDNDRIHLLRYSSFSRPIGFHKDETIEAMRQTYQHQLKAIGINELNAQELKIFDEVKQQGFKRKPLTGALNTEYAKRVQTLLKSETRPVDLVVCDEAQYLRHTANARNTNINAALGASNSKWLFLSATPLHSGQNDIKSLDTYLCSHSRDSQTSICSEPKCTNISAHMKGEHKAKMDVMDILSEFMVRRPRQYVDAKDQKYTKVAYRTYPKEPAVATNDAFASMVTALVQKRLVKSLAGNNNRFRQGECSSFESLASSAGNRHYKDCDGVDHKTEMEGNDATTTGETPDRFDIDELNNSLRAALVEKGHVNEADKGQYHLPHTKLYHVVDGLVDQCLQNAPNHKTLVFVRRLATVFELMVLLQQRFQKIVNQRVDNWALWIKQQGLGTNQTFDGHYNFWSDTDITGKDIELIDENDEDETSATNRAQTLPYFKAISQQTGARGMFASFLTRILQIPDKAKSRYNPLAFLVSDDDEYAAQWIAFIDAIYDGPALLDVDDIKALKRCLLQSMRRSDFVVDLYILQYCVKPQDHTTPNNQLTKSLIWLLQQAKDRQLPADLQQYLNNWRERLRNWCDNFNLIKQKCFKSTAKPEDIDAEFKLMGPILGRSGSIANKHAVTQFKMPCYPNILVCTDVLKEGVDMHLFCNEVIHYGVAWTSGDLEQRIGRVDRVNSLIHRQMQQHKGEQPDAPKLVAGFPYLDGTLDQHQVQRVIKDKKSSDLRMDFGKSMDEIKDMSIDETINPQQAQASDTQLTAREFLPNTLRFDENLKSITPPPIDEDKQYQNAKTVIDGCLAQLDQQTQKQISYRALVSLEAIEINYQSPNPEADFSKTLGDNLKSKWKIEKINRKHHGVENICCVLPLTIDADEIKTAIAELTNIKTVVGPTAINHIDSTNAEGFEFNEEYETLALTNDKHHAPHEQTTHREQTVILEHIGDWLLVRSPVININFSDDEIKIPCKESELPQWIAQQNNPLPFGYLNDHKDIIWFCCLIAYPQKLQSEFGLIVDKVSQTADRLQQLYTANDKEEWDYKAAGSS